MTQQEEHRRGAVPARFEVRAKHLLELAKWTAPRDYGRPVLQCLHFRLDGWVEAADGFRWLRVLGRGQMPGPLAGAVIDVREPGASLALWQSLLRFAKDAFVGVSVRQRARSLDEVVFAYAGTEVALLAEVGLTYPDLDSSLRRQYAEDAPTTRVALNAGFVKALTSLHVKDQAAILRFEVRGMNAPVVVETMDPSLDVAVSALVMPMFVSWSDEPQGAADGGRGDGVVPGDGAGAEDGEGDGGARAADCASGPAVSGVREGVE